MTIMWPNAMPSYYSEPLNIIKIEILKTKHYGLVISGPRINSVSFSNDAKGIEVPSGDSAAFGQ